jgi:hypothetical protein
LQAGGLLRDLELSLHRSRKALLALDLAGIEFETGEQRRRLRELAPLLWPGRELAGAGIRLDGEKESASDRDPAHGAASLSSAKAILEAARLQAALLRRAQGKMRVLANMLAGSAVTYGPFIHSAIRPMVRNAASYGGSSCPA